MAGKLEAIATYACEVRVRAPEQYYVDLKVSIPEVKKEKSEDTMKRFVDAAKKLNGMMVDGCYRRTFSQFKETPKLAKK